MFCSVLLAFPFVMPHIISGLYCVLLLFLGFLWFCYVPLVCLVFFLHVLAVGVLVPVLCLRSYSTN